MTEHETSIKAKLEQKGYHVYKNGLPDFLVRKGSRMFFVECKRGYDRLSPDQVAVKAALEQCGMLVVIAQDEPEDNFISQAELQRKRRAGKLSELKESMRRLFGPDHQRLAYTPKEVGAFFGHSASWAYRLIWAGKLKVLEGCDSVMVPVTEIERFVSEAEPFGDTHLAMKMTGPPIEEAFVDRELSDLEGVL